MTVCRKWVRQQQRKNDFCYSSLVSTASLETKIYLIERNQRMTKKHLILVVDDDAEWREIICEALEKNDYSVIQADNVDTAKSKLQEHQFSLVTVDLNYKKTQVSLEKGPELLTYIKKHFRETLPCIIITGSDKSGAEGATLALKFADVVKDYLAKNPQIPEILPQKIEAILDAISGKHVKSAFEQSHTQGQSECVSKKEIFISYAWGGESEEVVNKLDMSLQNKGITIIRDKRDLAFKGSIKGFMEQLGQGKAVIVVISEKYLKSENCMFELIQIAKNGKFPDRIFPIVLADAQIYKPTQRIKYVQHWEQQIKELDEAIKTVSSANLQGFREEIDQFTEIRHTMAELTSIIKDMNVLTPEMHRESDFAELFKAIELKLAE